MKLPDEREHFTGSIMENFMVILWTILGTLIVVGVILSVVL